MDDFNGSREDAAKRKLSPAQHALAHERLLTASFLQYMLPGAPSLYYADEAGMEGHKDPFNRRTYPWGKEDARMLAHHKLLGQLRKSNKALQLGNTEFFQAGDQKIGFTRFCDGQKLRIYVNQSNATWDIPAGNVLYGHNLNTLAPNWLSLAPMGFCITED